MLSMNEPTTKKISVTLDSHFVDCFLRDDAEALGVSLAEWVRMILYDAYADEMAVRSVYLYDAPPEHEFANYKA